MIGRRGLLRQALSARKQRETARSEFQYEPYTLLDELQFGCRETSRVVRKTSLIHGPQLIAHCNGIQPRRRPASARLRVHFEASWSAGTAGGLGGRQ